MEERPNYYAVIPADVRYNPRLKDKAKLLYGEIVALANKKGECWASNKYFADLYGVTQTTISTLIKELTEEGYIESSIIYKEGTKEILNRSLKIFKEGYLKNFKHPPQKILKENNTRINNTRINKKENIKEKYFDDNELNDLFLDFLDLRKKIKAVNSERAISNLINKLKKFDDDTKKQMLNNSITNSWKDVYEIKNRSVVPKWFNKEIKREEIKLSEDERRKKEEFVRRIRGS